jgi:O-antigen ligase
MLVYLMNGTGYSRSATSMFSLFVGIIVFIWLQYAPRDPELLTRYFIKGICAVFFVLVVSQLGIWFFTENRSIGEVTIEMSGRDSTLTGRSDLWEDILQYASKNPFTGVGYGSFWIGNLSHNLWDKHFWQPTQGHNGYIDIYVELGMIGLFLLGSLLLSAFGKIKNNIVANFEYGCFQIAMFIMIIIHNFAETSFLRGEVDLWFMFLLVTLNIQHPGLESPPAHWDME